MEEIKNEILSMSNRRSGSNRLTKKSHHSKTHASLHRIHSDNFHIEKPNILNPLRDITRAQGIPQIGMQPTLGDGSNHLNGILTQRGNRQINLGNTLDNSRQVKSARSNSPSFRAESPSQIKGADNLSKKLAYEWKNIYRGLA